MDIKIYNRANDLQSCITSNKIQLTEQKVIFQEVSEWKSPIPEQDLIVIKPEGVPPRFTFYLKREVLLQSIQDRIDELKETIQRQQQEFDSL
jgi:hypothetical protein